MARVINLIICSSLRAERVHVLHVKFVERRGINFVETICQTSLDTEDFFTVVSSFQSEIVSSFFFNRLATVGAYRRLEILRL